jgi:hypothetical protein
MATAADQTFIMACITAETTRQNSRATAYATYQAAGFTPAARATYVTAYVTADNVYGTAVANARVAGATNLAGNVCDFQPYGGYIASVSS